MRPLLNVALSVLLALQGFVAPAHACGGGMSATGAAATPADSPRDALAKAHADAEGFDCHGHGSAGEKRPTSVAGAVTHSAAGDAAAADAGDGGFGDCCLSGQCGCPCVTPAALPPSLAAPQPVTAPSGPSMATIEAVRPLAMAPLLRPPIT